MSMKTLAAAGGSPVPFWIAIAFCLSSGIALLYGAQRIIALRLRGRVVKGLYVRQGVVAFEPPTGGVYRCWMSSKGAAAQKNFFGFGDEVDVVYDPKHPKNCAPDGDQEGLLLATFLLLMGGVFIYAAVRMGIHLYH